MKTMSTIESSASPQIQHLRHGQAARATPAPAAADVFRIGAFALTNRLFVGTGKYQTYELMQQALDASGCQVVTVAVRRERLVDKEGRSLLDFLDLSRYVILPNTAGCFSAEDAIRVALLGRDLLEKNGNKGAGWVKLEVLGEDRRAHV